jgi:chromosome segregation ATPase
MIIKKTQTMMQVSAAVVKLAKLRADETRMDEQIRDTKEALTLVQKRVSERLAQRYMATNEPRVEIPEDLMKEEESFERLLQALNDMKNEIAKQIRPVEKQIIQTNVEHLRHSFNEERSDLNKCLESIDENILGCRQYFQDYERIRSSLNELNEKLSQLGAEPIAVPDNLPTTDFGERVQQRFEFLRSQGKI